MYYQQGDVLIKRIKEIPQKAIKKESFVLAEGEATGHCHRVNGEAEVLTLGDKVLLRVLAGNAQIVHEEHKTIVIPAGNYEVETVKEYDHFAEEVRRVRD